MTDVITTSVQGKSDAIDAMDVWLAEEAAYVAPGARAFPRRVDAIRRAVDTHRLANPVYDRYCRIRRFAWSGDDECDLEQVPLLPTALFKRVPSSVRSATGSGSVLQTTSSGTQGSVSTVPRCDATLMRFFASVAAGNRDVLGQERLDRPVLSVGPSTKDNPHLWIAYVMAGVGVLLPTRSYLNDGRLHADELCADLVAGDPAVGVTLIGPPPLIYDFASEVLRQGGFQLGARTTIVTIGGWKRSVDERVDSSHFRELTATAFGLAGTGQVRDTYNMVELNSVMFSCAHHVLHVPPWVHASARDPRTLGVTDGQGVLAFLDPTALSYPGFVLSDDIGTVGAGTCACGIDGQVVDVLRRVNRLETRGCALKLEASVIAAKEHQQTEIP